MKLIHKYIFNCFVVLRERSTGSDFSFIHIPKEKRLQKYISCLDLKNKNLTIFAIYKGWHFSHLCECDTYLLKDTHSFPCPLLGRIIKTYAAIRKYTKNLAIWRKKFFWIKHLHLTLRRSTMMPSIRSKCSMRF